MSLKDLDRMLTEKVVSAWLGVSLPSLQRMRANGTGPRFIRLSERRIAYRQSDVEAWLTARTCSSLDEQIKDKDAA